jgi:NAD(P)-dependent dehydrogenase (short-subunit alcohol dehydrogenase family)
MVPATPEMRATPRRVVRAGRVAILPAVPGVFDVEGRVAVVTGASSGLGARFARVLHEHGASVVLAARRADRIEAIAAELGDGRALAVPTDVADESAVAALIGATVDRFGTLDILVNNAGISRSMKALEETTETFREVVDVNLVGVFTVAREAARVMVANGRGSIVNVASALGLVGIGRIPQASYTASKGGVVNLTRELAAQWSRHGVRVNSIAPGWFLSEMTETLFAHERTQQYFERTVPMQRAGNEGELDGALLFLASDASSYVTGQTIAVDGGWTAV